MVIGFTEASQTISEGQNPNEDLFQLPILVSTLRTAERDHLLLFRVQESSSSATVEPIAQQQNTDFDALFGSRADQNDPIEELFLLPPDTSVIPPRATLIRNDFTAEPEECFVIRILAVDIEGRRELFSCNAVDSGATSYFCEHTVCITNDDGKRLIFITASEPIQNALCSCISEPFVVAFVETTYTVDETAAAVNVCVNLTQPQVDILDETVNVFVIDDSSSTYIPADAPLASTS